jgi:hypothetical protein
MSTSTFGEAIILTSKIHNSFMLYQNNTCFSASKLELLQKGQGESDHTLVLTLKMQKLEIL